MKFVNILSLDGCYLTNIFESNIFIAFEPVKSNNCLFKYIFYYQVNKEIGIAIPKPRKFSFQ